MSGLVNVGGSWKTANAVSVNVNGSWKTVSSGFVNVNDVWKQWYSSAPQPALELIATASGDGSSGSITFSSIPQTYKHLQIRFTARSTANTTVPRFVYVIYNGGSNPNAHTLNSSTSVTSTYQPDGGYGLVSYIPTLTGVSGSHAGGVMDILNYSDTNKIATSRIFSGYANGSTSNGSPAGITNVALTGNSNTTAGAITSLTFSTYFDGAFTSTSRFSLYGIKG